jgi:hypothetical protein
LKERERKNNNEDWKRSAVIHGQRFHQEAELATFITK